MILEHYFDRLHSRTVKNGWLRLLTAFTRVLLAIGFIPPSLRKILHLPFTVLPDSHPVGHYFNALYHNGFYYEFIGWAQLAAAILLLFPRTAHWGALLFLPVITNIAVLTNAVGFVGTQYITLLMLLACVYLVCWDYDRWKPFLFVNKHATPRAARRSFVVKYLFFPVLFSLAGTIGTLLLAFYSIGNLHQNLGYKLSFVAFGAFVFGLVLSLHHNFMRIGETANFSSLA